VNIDHEEGEECFWFGIDAFFALPHLPPSIHSPSNSTSRLILLPPPLPRQSKVISHVREKKKSHQTHGTLKESMGATV